MNEKFLEKLRIPAIIASLSLILIAGCLASTGVRGGAAAPAIKNFGRVNDFLYRGGQPEGNQYNELARMGIRTVLDLRADAEPDERSMVEKAGMRYLQLPLKPKEYPQPDAAPKFLAIVGDKSNWPIYVHCNGGRHRTGVMIAVYRMSVEKWNIEKAYAEMKDYDFYTRWGHGCYKDYVFDYYKKLKERQS